MEIIERDEDSRDDLVQIAFADTSEEAALIRGLLQNEGIRCLVKQASIDGAALGSGLLIRSTRRIYVRPDEAEAARRLLAETMVEEAPGAEVPESANAAYLADASGGPRPRDYSPLGAYVRGWLVAVAILAVVFVVFLLLH